MVELLDSRARRTFRFMRFHEKCMCACGMCANQACSWSSMASQTRRQHTAYTYSALKRNCCLFINLKSSSVAEILGAHQSVFAVACCRCHCCQPPWLSLRQKFAHELATAKLLSPFWDLPVDARGLPARRQKPNKSLAHSLLLSFGTQRT